MYILSQKLIFPPVQTAQSDGLLAIGGDLSIERLLLAYRSGIFPWFEGSTPLWWCPNPRFVLYPSKLIISKSMKQLIKKQSFEWSINKDFKAVINACKNQTRIGQDGTWITNEVEAAYTQLHLLGYAHSVETWLNGQLVGGLYGVRLGNIFFGESMFSTVSNASKFAFIQYVEKLKKLGVQMIDCQVYTNHLESLGAEMIPRELFIQLLTDYEADR